MVGWHPYNFTTGDLYAALSRHSQQGKTYPGSEPHGRVGPVELKGVDSMRAATKWVRRESALAAAEDRHR